MTNTTDLAGGELKELAEQASGTQIAPTHGIAAIALSMSLKYHDIATVQDGTLYQQYKLEGKNFQTLHLDMVFETAIRIERHLLESSERIASLMLESLEVVVEDDEPAEEAPDNHTPEVKP